MVSALQFQGASNPVSRPMPHLICNEVHPEGHFADSLQPTA
jgi:hypothetical protein